MSTPITTLTLYRTELQPDNVVMDWTAHLTHLQQAEKFTVLNCTFQRQNRNMRLPLSMDIAGRYNYASFVNDGKTYYCFITDMEYVNDNMTSATYIPDHWHTYQREIIYKPSFIERKIVSKTDDILGRYTAEEDVGTSTYIVASAWNDYPGVTQSGDNAYWYLLLDNGYKLDLPGTHSYGGFEYCGHAILTDALSSITARIAALVREDAQDSVRNVWMLPKSVIGTDPNIINSPITASQPIPLSIPTSVGDYIIKNNKTRTSPYMIVNASSTDGDAITLSIQDIINEEGAENVVFEKTAGLFPTPSATIRPRYAYRESNGRGLMTLICKQFPLPNIATSGIGIKDAISMVSTGISLGSGIAYQAASRALTKANMATIAESHRDKKTGRGGFLTKNERQRADALYGLNDAQTMGNVGGAELNAMSAISSIGTARGFKSHGTGGEMARGEVGFIIMMMTPDKEQTIAIDNYFSRYGYAINQIEDIELNNRSVWDYVKTQDASISVPNAPVDAEVAIKDMFDSGLTIFHSSTYFKRYDINNQ